MSASGQQHTSRSKLRAWEIGNRVPTRRRARMLCVSVAICVLTASAFIPGPNAGQEDSAGEYELKGAMLYNLMHFVEWPVSAYSSSQAPTVLCILGRDPFGNSLTSLVSDKLVDGRPVQIRLLKDMNGTRACHVLYISSSERKHVVEILSNLKGANVLTVGEMSQFATRGGMVQFSLYEKRIRLDINLDAANRAGVKISSRLLAIARIVKSNEKTSSKEASSTGSQVFESVDLPFPGGSATLASI